MGVDIGCGMAAVRPASRPPTCRTICAAIRRRVEAAIPVGFIAHEERLGGGRPAPCWGAFDGLSDRQVQDRFGRARRQMGTLGGGNHFIELCLDDDDRVWIMLHSGSRNIGKELAEVHIAVAQALPHNADLPDRDLAVFLDGHAGDDAYRRDLFWAQEYARLNRATMSGSTWTSYGGTSRTSPSASRSPATTTTWRRSTTTARTCW